MNNLDRKTKTIITAVGILILFIIGIVLIIREDKNKYEEYVVNDYIEDETEIESKNTEKIKVHITGEVNKEGIVEVEEGARIYDIIEAAGGETENANLNEINLAYKLEDGQKVYIPSSNEIEEKEYIIEDSGHAVIEEDKKISLININIATQTELETLSGIGPSTALKIITYREQNGKFKSIEDLKNIAGIGEAKFESIKDYICVK